MSVKSIQSDELNEPPTMDPPYPSTHTPWTLHTPAHTQRTLYTTTDPPYVCACASVYVFSGSRMGQKSRERIDPKKGQ